MAYQSIVPVFDEKACDFLDELTKNYTKTSHFNEEELDKLYHFFESILEVQSFIKTIESDNILNVLALTISPAFQKLPWQKCAVKLSNSYRNLVVYVLFKKDKILKTIYTVSPDKVLNAPTEVLNSYVTEAGKLKDCLLKNRVVVLKEYEGRSYYELIRLALSILKVEGKPIVPFHFNESHHSYLEAFTLIYSFLTEIHDVKGLKPKLDALKNTHDRLMLLTKTLREVCFPVFVFENIASWFDKKGKPLYTHRDITDWLYALAGNEG
ncbi:MAG: hypothetical protein AAGI07_07565, partial [Bacteroidota bacterium]